VKHKWWGRGKLAVSEGSWGSCSFGRRDLAGHHVLFLHSTSSFIGVALVRFIKDHSVLALCVCERLG